ncbi:hypothetical protein J437_LFUL004836 [Ladona fulva]|uniref:NF-X1-type domain-containing protein n=1 Tax=Ladona fulva TaxID=123851 RepID=A0A8K0NZB8_LADFU|nr:hypothetical protein J437_LFUL004836 [Ladona fulva]
MTNRINLKIMKEADFVGITTTGAARQQALLQELGAKIVIVEEAAEVMESHVIVSLSNKCEHLILIGNLEFYGKVEFCLSKRNAAEAGFLIALCRHIILQGYHPKQITILTFYLGQMFTLIEEREKHSKMTDVKIACVDNYQGEENDIILLSLVRSNEEGKIGFLISENRICVALSRAKKALYVIGNMDLVASKSVLWKRVLEVLKKKGAIGSKLKLKCVKHPQQLTEVSKVRDFVPITEGGCTLMCNTDLSCGHICKRKCHLNSHDTYKCKEICGKEMCIYRHKCKKLCFQDCGECMVPLYGELPCGHWVNVPCCVDPVEYKCNVVVTVILQPCGHEIKKKCFEDVKIIKCTWGCESRLPCGHACRLKCHVGDDPDHNKYKCLRPCGRKKLNCNQEHLCEKKCFEECSHCTSKLKRKLPNCDHFHTMECSTDASSIVCQKKCYRMLECGHLCPLRCFEECGGCKVVVVKKIEECNHEVNIECSMAPERKLCNDKCESFLPCGHKCEMLCREPCQPNSCKVLVEETVESPCGHQVWKSQPCPEDALNHVPKLFYVNTIAKEHVVPVSREEFIFSAKKNVEGLLYADMNMKNRPS